MMSAVYAVHLVGSCSALAAVEPVVYAYFAVGEVACTTAEFAVDVVWTCWTVGS